MQLRTKQTKGNAMPDASGNLSVSADHLRSFIQRIEKLEEDKAAIAADIKDVYAEAKGSGFDTKIMRKVISLRKMETQARREQEELIELYMSAMGGA